MIPFLCKKDCNPQGFLLCLGQTELSHAREWESLRNDFK